MGRLEETVTEFLAEGSKSNAIAVTLCQQDSVVKAMFQVLEDTSFHATFLEPICELLFRFCRSELEELQRFSSYFIPTALALYLRLNRHPGAKATDLVHLEVYLLAAYNIETCDADGKEIVHSFTIPALHKPSIYHESMVPPSAAILTENALSRLEQGLQETRVVIGPFEEAVRITRDNVHRISALLMRVYNANISYMPGASREATLRGAQKVISQRSPRIELNSEYLLEVLHCAYFSMFNGQYVLGDETVSLVRTRARQSLLAEVCLVANAMRQSLLDSKDSAKAAQQPMGIRVTVNSSFKNLTKNVLTNASFRTRKLSEESAEDDDIGGTISSTSTAGVGLTKREVYKAQLHETLGSIDESIEITQVHVDTDVPSVGVHKSNSNSSGKVRKGSLVLVDSIEGTVSNANGTMSTNSTNV